MQNTTTDKLVARIRAYRAHREWSVNRLAREAGLRESSIRNIDRPDWNPQRLTLNRLESIIPPDFKPLCPKPKKAK